MTAKNARAVALALLLFVYPIIVLSFASIRYTETIHRISTSHTFDQSLFGSVAADSLAALGFLALFTSLAFSSKAARIGSIAVFAAWIALYLASPSVLQLAGIATLPSLVALLAVTALANRNKPAETESRSFRFGKDELYRVGSALLAIIIILEIGALAKWVSHPFFPSEIYSEGDPSWRFAELESALFHSLGLLSPYLVALIAFSFFYKWFMPEIFRRLKNIERRGDHQQSDSKEYITSESLSYSSSNHGHNEDEMGLIRHRPQQHSSPYLTRASSASKRAESGTKTIASVATAKATPEVIKRNAHWIILSVALVSAPLLMMYPHLAGINPDSSGISTDERYYMNWMSELRTLGGSSWGETVANAFKINDGDRPLTLLIILTIANMTGQPDLMVIRYLPVILAPMLVLANYVLIRYSLKTKNESKLKFYASIGAVFAVFSPQIVVGEYAGFLSNWIALIAAYFALYFMIKGWESQDRRQAVVSFMILSGILLITMLIHLYTWANFLVVILVFAGISYLFARKSVTGAKFKALILLAVVVTAFSIDYAKSLAFATTGAAESDSVIASNIQLRDTGARWDRLHFTLSSYVGGFLSNPALFLLGLVWIARSDQSEGLGRVMLSMFFIMAFPIMFGSVEFQTRVLYNIPFHIPALLVLYGTKVDSKILRSLLLLAIIVSSATYAMHAMANLYMVLPDGFGIDGQILLP